MCIKKNVKLIIIDSIAGVARYDFHVLDNNNTSDNYNNNSGKYNNNDGSSKMSSSFDNNSISRRTQFLFQLSSKLKWLADTFNVSIVVVNQVSDVVIIVLFYMIFY